MLRSECLLSRSTSITLDNPQVCLRKSDFDVIFHDLSFARAAIPPHHMQDRENLKKSWKGWRHFEGVLQRFGIALA